MDTNSRFVVTPRMVLGLSVVLVGVLLAFDRLGVSQFDRIFRLYWPVPIMVIGGLTLVQAQSGRDRFRGLMIALVGGWLFLNVHGLVPVRLWELFWPAIIILIGVRMLMPGGPPYGRGRHRHLREQLFGGMGRFHDRQPFGSGTSVTPDVSTGSPDPSDLLSLFAVWSSARRTSSSPAFAGGDITAIMGGAQLDLRLASIPAGKDAVLDITAIMGGVELYVPSHWEVSTPIVPFMGAVEDERLPPIQTDATRRAASGRLVVRGFVLMGGVQIKS